VLAKTHVDALRVEFGGAVEHRRRDTCPIGEIADALVISHETVRSHVKSIMRKLDVHSRHDAPAAAERLRVVAV